MLTEHDFSIILSMAAFLCSYRSGIATLNNGKENVILTKEYIYGSKKKR